MIPDPGFEHPFWNKVDRTKSPKKGCWPWLGACNNTGYGTLRWAGSNATAHRVAYHLTHGTPSKAPLDRTQSGFILHSCDNRRCCNPNHMRLGTYAENQSDAYTRARRLQPQGHLHANAKLTSKQVVDIRLEYAIGRRSQTQLAHDYAVSQRVISLLVRGLTYANT